MTLERPIPMQAIDTDMPFSFTAAQIRAGLVGSIFSRPGVVGPEFGALRLSQRAEGASLSFDIAAGRVVVQGDDASDQGIYVCNSTARENRATPQPPGSGSRRHRVIARARDRAHNTAWAPGTYDWTIEVLADLGSGPPDEPPTAETIGFVRMRAGQVSILDSDLDRTPNLHVARATVGTPDRSGSFALLSAYTPQASRPPRWRRNSDGWVQIGGWARRTAATTDIDAQTQYTITATPLPEEIRPVGFRDFPMVSSMGVLQGSVLPNGHIAILSFVNTRMIQNQTWISLDGCGYLL